MRLDSFFPLVTEWVVTSCLLFLFNQIGGPQGVFVLSEYYFGKSLNLFYQASNLALKMVHNRAGLDEMEWAGDSKALEGSDQTAGVRVGTTVIRDSKSLLQIELSRDQGLYGL